MRNRASGPVGPWVHPEPEHRCSGPGGEYRHGSGGGGKNGQEEGDSRLPEAMGVRVLPPAPRGIVTLNAVAGMCVSMLFLVAEKVGAGGVLTVVLAAAVGVLFVAWLGLMASVIPRVWFQCLCVCVMWFSLGVVTCGYRATDPLLKLPTPAENVLAEMAGTYAPSVVMMLLVALAWRGGIRMASGRTLRQDGSMCWGCGYSREGATTERCPECSTSWEIGHAPGRMWKRIPLVARMSGYARVALLVLVLTLAGFFWNRLGVRRANEEFAGRMTERGMAIGASTVSLDADARTSGTQYPMAVIRLPGWQPRSTASIWLTYDARARGEKPAMLARLMVWRRRDAKVPTAVPSGVYSELSQEQARFIIERGMPQSLVSEFHALAEAAFEGTGGGKRIDATPHFPKTGASEGG